MKLKTTIALSIVTATLVLGGGLYIYASQSGNKDEKLMLEATAENPFMDKSETEIKADDIYAKGKEIVITQDEMQFQKKMIKAYGGEGTDEEAFIELCRYKSELQEALSLGYETTDEEFEEYNKGIIELYHSLEEKDPVTEAFGGIEEYQRQTEALNRNKLLINKYWNDQRKNMGIGNQIEDNDRWLEAKKSLEQELIDKQEIVKVDNVKN